MARSSDEFLPRLLWPSTGMLMRRNKGSFSARPPSSFSASPRAAHGKVKAHLYSEDSFLWACSALQRQLQVLFRHRGHACCLKVLACLGPSLSPANFRAFGELRALMHANSPNRLRLHPRARLGIHRVLTSRPNPCVSLHRKYRAYTRTVGLDGTSAGPPTATFGSGLISHIMQDVPKVSGRAEGAMALLPAMPIDGLAVVLGAFVLLMLAA